VKIIVFSSGEHKNKWLDYTFSESISLCFSEVFLKHDVADADLVIDATGDLFKSVPQHIPVLVHCLYPLQSADRCVVRTCLWPGFWEKGSWEAAGLTLNISRIQKLLEPLGQKLLAVADIPGLIAPRVLATIVNEAAFTLSEGIATAGDIDVAMRLGTNYPAGPIEWARQIGPEQIYDLLEHLSQTDIRYKPCPDFVNLLKNAYRH
jgi:3-hydroxybutyryl-CoA dehydrogenase